MYRMDHAYDRHRYWLTVCKALEDAERVFSREYLYDVPGRLGRIQDDADMFNPRRLMWANDFPHSDSTWPNSQELLQQALAIANRG